MKEIVLTNHIEKCIVDDDDYESLITNDWYFDKKRNAIYACFKLGHNKYHTKKIGPVILNISKKGFTVKNINLDVFDNRKENLCVEPVKSQLRRIGNKISSSKYLGVKRLPNGRYRSTIQVSKVKYHIGIFKNETEAAMAYNKKAKELLGENAVLNEIPNE